MNSILRWVPINPTLYFRPSSWGVKKPVRLYLLFFFNIHNVSFSVELHYRSGMVPHGGAPNH